MQVFRTLHLLPVAVAYFLLGRSRDTSLSRVSLVLLSGPLTWLPLSAPGLLGKHKGAPRSFLVAQMVKQCRRPGFNPWVGKIPWRRKWQPTPVSLPGESHGQRIDRLQSMGPQSRTRLSDFTFTFRSLLNFEIQTTRSLLWLLITSANTRIMTANGS